MVDTSTLVLVAILLFDFVVSLWNAYASGVVWGLLRRQPGHTFEKVCAVAGVGLAFSGMAYATSIVLSWVALQVGFLAIWDFLYLVSFDFLVFGAMIIGFGLVVTAQSVAIAYRQRNFGSIAVAVWNTFAEVWDIAIYVQGFQTAAGVLKGDRRDRANVVAILAVAIAVALIITYFAFRQGLNKAAGAIDQNPAQAAGDARGAPPEDRHHHRIRQTVAAGLVVVILVIAAIAVFHFLPPSPQVQVSEIDVWAPSNACGLAAQPISYAGFTDAPGAREAFQLQVQNFNTTDCTVAHVATNTSGFSLSDLPGPLSVPGGGSAFLNLTIDLPSTNFSGNLILIYT